MQKVLFIVFFLLIGGVGRSQQGSDVVKATASARGEIYPNMSIKSILTPIAWSSKGVYVFGGIGGSAPQPYRDYADLAAGGGFGLGNAYKAVSVTAIWNVNNVSRFKDFSASFIANRNIGKGSSVSAGALHLFVEKSRNDPGPSYYVVFSHAVQKSPSRNFMVSWLNYSIGVGNGRFYYKSPKDRAEGKGSYGTAVFGNISYEAFKNFNINLEWTGLNLAIGTAWRPSYKFPALAIGVADITSLSGSPRFIFSLGHAFMLTKTN